MSWRRRPSPQCTDPVPSNVKLVVQPLLLLSMYRYIPRFLDEISCQFCERIFWSDIARYWLSSLQDIDARYRCKIQDSLQDIDNFYFHMDDTTFHCLSNARRSMQFRFQSPELLAISEWTHFLWNTLYNLKTLCYPCQTWTTNWVRFVWGAVPKPLPLWDWGLNATFKYRVREKKCYPSLNIISSIGFRNSRKIFTSLERQWNFALV